MPKYTESKGIRGEQVAAAWGEALCADKPVLLEAITDPEIVAFTPQVAARFAKKLAAAIEKGDFDAGRHLEKLPEEAVRQAAQELLAKSILLNHRPKGSYPVQHFDTCILWCIYPTLISKP